MAMAWTRDLNTGVEVIDSQHQRIVHYINLLEEAHQQNNPQLVGAVLVDLSDYTLSHFSFEESLQEELGYMYAKQHKAVHDMFIKRLAGYQQRHNAGESVAGQLHGMLSTWLIHHIKRDDMAYVAEVGAKATQVTQDKREGGWFSRSIQRFFG